MSRVKALLAALLLVLPCAALAQAPQFGAGQIFGNSTSATRPGRVEAVTAILDRALGSTRGSILERGASGWVIVGPSATTGLAWVSQGAGADPIYGVVSLSGGGCAAALTASNGGILYSTATTCAVLAGTATARLPLLSGASTTPQWGAFTLPASVNSGGVACYTSTTAQGSSSTLTLNSLLIGGGSGACPSNLGSLGTTTTVLHGNAGGAPTFGAVSLTADVSGQLGLANGGCAGTTAATCFSNAAPTPTRAGDVIYWNGASWTTLAGNNSGTQVLSENSSGVPSWAAPGAGTVTSITPGGGLVSSITASCSQTAVTNTGTLSGAECVNPQTGTSYAIADSDRGKLVTASNTAAQAYSIAQAGTASNFQAGWFADIKNIGTNVAGIVTITPTTSTINGATTLALYPGQSARIVSDGTNYQAILISPNEVLLETLTASASASVSTSVSWAGYNNIKFVFRNVLAATAGGNFLLQVNSGGVQNTGYLNSAFSSNNGGALAFNIGTTAIMLNGGNSLGTTNPGSSGVVTLPNVASTTQKKAATGTVTNIANGVTQANVNVIGGWWDTGSGAITGAQFSNSAGNLTSGSIEVWASH